MKPKNLDSINRSFEIQAENFESEALQFTKEAYLKYTVEAVAPKPGDRMLEAAAGTCACGRAFAPSVRLVVCLDATAPMLEVGRRQAEKSGLDNMVFVKGCVEELPFLDESFDIVFSRLAFHHFTLVRRAFSEMARCLKPGGKLVLIDMEAAEESLRAEQDAIETLRDPSHVRNLSVDEMHGLFADGGLKIEKSEVRRIQQVVSDWMALTKTPEDVQAEISGRFERELRGETRTGFSPYIDHDRLCFDQRWRLIVGIK